ncbi:MAG TPA: C40 family peptidase [Lachnospiraceae bacterium]|nr:C40 family peptidase [Lachnospiraceae bacterium]
MRKRFFSTIIILGFLFLLLSEAGNHQNVQVSKSTPEERAISQTMSDCLLCQSGVLMNSLFYESRLLNSEAEDGTIQGIVSGNDASFFSVSSNSVSENTAQDDNEYDNLALADVSDYVNVRTEPNTDSEIVGKIYDGAVAQILLIAGDQDEWFYVVSGSVKGYIKSEYFIYGEAAQAVIDAYVKRFASVNADRLNVRKEPVTDAKRIGYIDCGEKVQVLEDCGDWLRVQYTGDTEGYIAAEYVTVSEEFSYAISIEEEKAQLAMKQALQARENVSEQDVPENTMTFTLPETTYTSNEELRQAIVEYAKQYLGNVYIHGGKNLSGGTDCSGFTCFVYADFGYSISRTPSGQYSDAGRSIDMSEIQPGDIICYSSNGKSCTHVALYIGDGQIIHAANSRKGVIINQADYSTIIGVRNVID